MKRTLSVKQLVAVRANAAKARAAKAKMAKAGRLGLPAQANKEARALEKQARRLVVKAKALRKLARLVLA
jgi:hypothetical protein